MLEIKFEKEKNKSIAYDNNIKIGECVLQKKQSIGI